MPANAKLLEELRQKRRLRPMQARFTSMLARLVLHAEGLGYEVVIDYVRRCRDCPVGIPASLHKKKLAADLNLFRDGQYLTKSEDYRPLGEYWEYLGGSWGGRFGDGNHFSVAWEGVK